MLLAVDIGNTSTKFGIFDGERLVSKLSIPTDPNSTIDGLRSLVSHRIDGSIYDAIVCSVVPKAGVLIREFLTDLGIKAPVFVTNDLDFGLKIEYEPLSDIGTDRLVNSFAAAEKYGVPCIVCSFGTATTIDVIDQDRELRGGVIAPGMKTMARALYLQTAQLPDIEIEKPKNVLGNTTDSAIRSGIFYGQIEMVKGMIERIKKECGDNAKVIATGGFASIIAENTAEIDFLDNDLTLEGLSRLYWRLTPLQIH
jgi:type III pantothenate kinase